MYGVKYPIHGHVRLVIRWANLSEKERKVGKHNSKPEKPRTRIMSIVCKLCHSGILHTGLLEVVCGCAAITVMERIWPVASHTSTIAAIVSKGGL